MRASELDPPAEERAAARQILLARLTRETAPWAAVDLAGTVARLDPSAEERDTAAWQILFTLLTRGPNPETAGYLADAVAELDPSAEERAAARQTLLTFLSRETNPETAGYLADAVARLRGEPPIRELLCSVVVPCCPHSAAAVQCRAGWAEDALWLDARYAISDLPAVVGAPGLRHHRGVWRAALPGPRQPGNHATPDHYRADRPAYGGDHQDAIHHLASGDHRRAAGR
jgi:hypothetical protein